MYRLPVLRLAIVLFAVVPALALSYKDGPPLRHTGDFGEPTCLECHFDGMLNGPEAETRLSGLPASFVPDSTYRLTVVVLRRDLGAGGFSMSSRFSDGKQAGAFHALDERVAVKSDTDGVQFAMHTYEGTEPLSSDSTAWTLAWVAPDVVDTVIFSLAGNSANGDDSEFGDFISTLSARTAPAEK